MQSALSSKRIDVLVADSNQMQSQLLVSALRRRPEFHVVSCAMNTDVILTAVKAEEPQVAILNADHDNDGMPDLSSVRRLHLAHPEIPKILLLESYSRELVVSAFRSGVRGLFCFAEYPFRLLCRCIHSVRGGEIWANAQQIQYLVDVVTRVPSLRVVNARGRRLLTPREEQVVALVADGLSNRDVAHELRLTEHTVKKYLYRIFEKLGISSRVELVLYAVNHGDHREAEWLAGG